MEQQRQEQGELFELSRSIGELKGELLAFVRHAEDRQVQNVERFHKINGQLAVIEAGIRQLQMDHSQQRGIWKAAVWVGSFVGGGIGLIVPNLLKWMSGK